MNLSEELNRLNTLFIDTAPVIYFIEAHPQFGPLAKEVVNTFQSGSLSAFSSVITLTEVLSKPSEAGDETLKRGIAERLIDSAVAIHTKGLGFAFHSCRYYYRNLDY